MIFEHANRTDSNREFGYKVLDQRRKKSSNLPWFRFVFAPFHIEIVVGWYI